MKLTVVWNDGSPQEFTLSNSPADFPERNIPDFEGWLVFSDAEGCRHFINLQHVRNYVLVHP